MITKKSVIIFLLIIAIIIILMIKHNRKQNNESNMFNIEHFQLNLNIQQENDLNDIITTYYNNDTEYNSTIINKFGIFDTYDINVQKDLTLTNNNNTFNNIKTGDLTTTTLNANNANIDNVNNSQNIVNTTNNYNKFSKLNVTDVNSNTIVNTNNTKFNNLSISDNLTIKNPNFNNSTMYINSLCFDNNNCFDKSIFNNINEITKIEQQYTNPVLEYMYLPNSKNAAGNTINDKNLIWNDIKNEISPNNNAEGRLKSVRSEWKMDYNSYNFGGKCIYKTSYWGRYSDNGQGIEVKVPEHPNKSKGEDYTVLWVQTLGERWGAFRVYEFDTNAPATLIVDEDTKYFKKYFHKHISGFDNLNKISPDGATHTEQWNLFEWTPIPIDLSGNALRKIIIGHIFRDSGDGWISGIAFSTNPWNHYRCSARELYYLIHNYADNERINIVGSPSGDIFWGDDWHNWNNAPMALFYNSRQIYFRVPFVNSGKDKIFYIIEHNNNWSPSIAQLSILKKNEYIKLGNFYTSFDNPFATHFNSKIYQKYYGIRIPKEHLPAKDPLCNDYLNLRLSTTESNNGVYFREVGSHDLSPF